MAKKIKPMGTLSVTEIGNANIPKIIREELGIEKGDIAYVVDAHVALLFNPNVDADLLLKSLRHVVKNVELRVMNEGEMKE
jgi:bifunctional DNA-binding transcriptional regulator/antitoxin component of YhaV-PrlF toxin-antitoxin module